MAELRFPNEGSIPEFLAALAAPEDPRGAVAAAAVAAAMGASLLQMVAALPHTVRLDEEDETALVSTVAVLVGIQEELLETVETDTAVKVFTARNMPQVTKAERVERDTALQFALRAAADVPLEVMRLCGRALQYAEAVARHSSRRASVDVALGVALLEAALNAVRSDLEAKLPSLTDALHVTSLAEEVARLSHEAAAAAEAGRSLLSVPPT